MPLYEILHAIPLTLPQKDTLAQSITKIHSTKFTTAKNFVNVSFHDVSSADTYVGGKRHKGNHIRGHVRAGPSRTQQDWNELSMAVERAWYDVVGAAPVLGGAKAANGVNGVSGTGTESKVDTTLRSVIIIGGIIGGLEAGFALPPAGQDVQWLQENWAEFNRKADAGDEEMKEMVAEVKERGLLEQDSGKGLEAAKKRLEEMLGWGDSA